MKTLILLAAITLLTSCAGVAQEDDGYRQFRRSCRYSDADCKKEWQEKKADERAARYAEESKARAKIAEEKRREEEAQRTAAYEARRKKEKEENDAAIERTRKMLDDHAKEERAAAKREQEVKVRCGADYRQPKIGMPLARAQECVGKLRMTSQINREDGVVSTYLGPGLYIHVMNGLIVSWGKY